MMVAWLCVVGLVGCAAGAEMRPRGKRNSVRIESLEKRIVTLEGQLAAISKELAVMQARPVASSGATTLAP